jgi:hypothetical protein
MPKELCHFMIARQAALRLDAGAAPRTTEAVRAHPETFLLGAVAHDCPFYSQADARVVGIATRLHGQGADDAYAPVKRAIATVADGTKHPPQAAAAFAAGALCHIAGDSVFHPAVFYFTGFASHASVAVSRSYLFRHREFETAMDLHLLPEHGAAIERRLDRLVARATAGPEAGEILGAVARFYATSSLPPSPTEGASILVRAGATQKLFFSRLVRLLLRAGHIRSSGSNADTSALFYARSTSWASYFTSPRPYRDPVTGVDGIFDVREFFGRAVDLAASSFGNLERALAGEANAFPQPGPSLESGRPLDQDQQMKHCDPALARRGDTPR